MPRDSFCVAGAVFAEVGVWLFVAGAAFGDILGDSRSAKLYFSIQNRLRDRTSKVSEAAGARWRFYPRIILGMSSNRLSIGGSNSESFQCNLELKDFVAGAVFGEVRGWHCLLRALEMTFHMWRGSIMRFILRGRRSIWWTCRLTFVAPRIVNDVSYVTRINHEIHFAWQAQYMVKLSCDFCCSAHCKWRFICDADQSWDSFCVAGAVFGEVGVSLFVAGAAFRAILGDSRSAKCCIFPYKMRLQDGTSKVSEAAGARWRFYPRIILGMSSNRLSIGGSNSESFQCNLELKDFVAGAVFGEVRGWHCLLRALEMTFHMWRGSIMRFILRGRRSIWWTCRLTFVAPRIVNDVSYVTRINHEIHFAWQAQYLVRFEVDFACSAHSKWRFICEADQSWDSFCVAGAVFGEGGGWLLSLRAF